MGMKSTEFSPLWAKLKGGPGDNLDVPIDLPTERLVLPISNFNSFASARDIPPDLHCGYLEFHGRAIYRRRESPYAGVYIYEFEKEVKGPMWCGYCHGSHEGFDEVMQCRHQSELLETQDEFWTPELVVAYRGFSVDWTSGVPQLKGVKEVWETAEPPKAQCKPFELTQFEHPAPKVACMCGYYGFKAPEDVAVWAVEGKVEMWGDIIEHEKGYRAEYVRLVAIRPGRVTPVPVDSTMQSLRERYGVGDGGDW